MSLYDILLDDLLSKSRGKLHREETDKAMTELSAVLNLPKWHVLISYGQVFFAYADFKESMLIVERGEVVSESELFQIRENLLQMGRED